MREDNLNFETLLNLARDLECRVIYDEPLSAHSTFKIGGNCYALVDISSEDSLSRLVKLANSLSVRYMVLGRGSNVLFDDRGFNGIVFKIAGSFDSIELVSENSIRVQAGCSLIKLCRFALEHSLSGLEFAYGIPGTVGGAIYMNAGAYGGEIKDVIDVCRSVNTAGLLVERDLSQLELGYRTSCFHNNADIITSGVFVLQSGNYDTIQDTMVNLMGKRKQKQPLEFPSAGSTFKRPEGQFAGKLIDDCGLRGYSVGGAQVSEKHCGFVINKDNATSADVLMLIKNVQDKVKEKTGYFLECEVKYIPYEA